MTRQYKSTMLVSPTRVKESGELNINVEDRQIGAAIRVAQNIYIRDVIGKDLLEKLQELVYNKIQGSGTTIDDEPAYKTFLDEYLQDAIVYKTIIELCIRISLQIRNMGVIQNYDTNVQASSLDDIKYLQNYLETLYNDKLNRIVEFLCANKEAIPEGAFVCDSCKPITKYANTNLYLGHKH